MSKYFSLAASLVVGPTFVVSGAVKLNDPLGFSYKIEEYLQVLASQLTSYLRLLLPYTLTLAILVATLEVVLGTALLLHWQRCWTVWALLLLTLFFTGLTLYTATSERMASCGCFGDALHLTPWQSFAKSVLLLLLLGGLLGQQPSTPTSLSSHCGVATALLLSLGLSAYSLRHLPLIDLLPYKVGSNLAQLVQSQAPLRYLYTLEKDGKTIETEQYPTTPGFKFVAARLLNPQDAPTATQFTIWQGAQDSTQMLLEGQKLLLIAQTPDSIPKAALSQLQAFIQQLPTAIQPLLLAPTSQGKELAATLSLPLHTANPVLLQTMLRAPWGLLYLQDGVVIHKWHY
ncbi:MAG: MauE/DoxX family redox-associated membrane protein, partial [Bacteroidota bacterium]